MKKYGMSTFIILILASLSVAASDGRAPASLQKTVSLNDTWMDVNRLHGVMRNNGIWFYNVLSANDGGLWWPRGTRNMTIYGAGQMVGAMVNGAPRIAGVIHDASEFQPGMIPQSGLEPPVGDNRLDPKYRWYTLRSDGTGDWNNWPVDQGAPVDKNGKPLLIGDQTAFCVYNDAGEHTKFSTPKLGVEIRQTVWGFNRADVIGDMLFIKWQLVNKSANNWDETYFVIWSDPDLGDGWDDFVGCDTTNGLGYVYNADDDDPIYGAAPPACGIDFFQGPIVDSPGDTVRLPGGAVLPNKKMLKMTSFIYYNNNDSPQGNPQTGGDVWNFMRGFWRDGSAITFGGTGVDPTSLPTKFMFSGDPETAGGWNDSQTSDRRFMMATGPYRMEKWSDTNGNGKPDFGEPGVQEIVAGVMVGRGTNNFNSVTYLKAIDQIAQLAYDINFALPRPPKAPLVQVSQTPNQVLLSWDQRSELAEDGVSPYVVEDIVANGLIGQNMVVDGEYAAVTDGTYDFTGYSVYQFSDAGGGEPVLLERLGPEKISDATPYGEARHIRLTINKHPRVGAIGDPLINGKVYYFGVQAGSYCKFAIPQFFPSPMTIVTVIPQNYPGTRSTSANNDTVRVVHTSSSGTMSDGSTIVTVIDPAKTTGLDYTVSFNPDMTWNLVNSRGDSLLKKQTNQRGDNAYTVKDGLLVKVAGPNPGINLNLAGPFGVNELHMGYGITNTANRWISWADDWGLETANHAMGNGFSFFGSTLEAWEYVHVEMKYAGCTDHSDNSAAVLAAKSKVEDPARWSKAVVYRRDLGYAVQSQLADIPFVVFDTETNRQLKVAIVEDARPAVGSGNFLWDMGWDGTAFKLQGGREYIFILNDTYDDQYSDYINGAKNGTGRDTSVPAPVMYAMCWSLRSATRPYLAAPFEIQIFASHINTVNDKFKFTAPSAPLTDPANIKEDLKKINVVPNPYYGSHSGEMNPFSRWVQFTNLPAQCTIRIFDLTGNLVRHLEKTDPSATLLQWDLENAYGLPVASGVYVYHVEVPHVGNKVGKLALFTPNERLDAY